jgi:hypothetical protein
MAAVMIAQSCSGGTYVARSESGSGTLSLFRARGVRGFFEMGHRILLLLITLIRFLIFDRWLIFSAHAQKPPTIVR